MAASSATICNLALSHLGGSAVVITTLSTDTTLEGKACRAFYETARRETLMAYPWHVAQKAAALTLIELVDDTEPEWVYKYRVPEDALTVSRVKWAGIRTPVAQNRVPFAIRKDTESTTYDAGTTYAIGDYAESVSLWYKAIAITTAETPASSPAAWTLTTQVDGVPPDWLYCDVVNAECEYTMNLTDTRYYTPDLDNAIAAKLALYIAPKVAAGDKAVRGEMAQMWQLLIRQAQANDAMAEQPDAAPASSFEAARHEGGVWR